MRVDEKTKIATRMRILDVARKLFAERGFDATTTRDIASEASIAVGTLFNYFTTKEAIAESLVNAAYEPVARKFSAQKDNAEPRTLEEELFAHAAAILRKLAPFRKYLPAVLETALSPLATSRASETNSFRIAHLETVVQIASRQGKQDGLSSLTLQMYWTLFSGVLAFWASDCSPRQEDTIALLDQSMSMFVGWLMSQSNSSLQQPKGG